MAKFKRTMKEIEITRKPAPLHAWKPGDSPNRIAVIGEDICSLMRQVAEAKLSLREQEHQQTEKNQQLLLSLVEVLDAFERVFRHVHSKEDLVTPQMKIWVGNFSSVRRLLERVLSEQDVTRIEIVDRTFDPQWHKVAEVVVDATKPEGTIVEEVKKGFLWRNQILRKAEVVVVRNAPGGAEEPGEEGSSA